MTTKDMIVGTPELNSLRLRIKNLNENGYLGNRLKEHELSCFTNEEGYSVCFGTIYYATETEWRLILADITNHIENFMAIDFYVSRYDYRRKYLEFLGYRETKLVEYKMVAFIKEDVLGSVFDSVDHGTVIFANDEDWDKIIREIDKLCYEYSRQFASIDTN